MLKRLILTAGLFALSTEAMAKSPSIVTDIAPIHSLVSMVAGSDASIDVLITGNTSPHDFSLKPSQASDLQNADIVFFVGTALSPWLEKSLANLAQDAVKIELLNASGTTTLHYRDVESFGEDNDHGHDHESGVDPHGWMSSENASVWIKAIALTLGQFDPQNADKYAQNASAATKKLEQNAIKIKTDLAPYSDQPIVLFHDAFQYFEDQFNLTTLGAFSLADGAKPSPKQVIHIQNVLKDNDIQCLFIEPQMNTAILDTANASDIKRAILDPLDNTIELGANYYPELLNKTTQTIKNCLTD